MNMVKILKLTMLALVMFSLNARCDPPTKAEEPAVYVAGGVQKPGRYDWFKGMTLLDVIKAAGGLSDPSVSTVRVAITHADHTQVIYPFSPGADASKKLPLLQVGDTVYVAKTFKSPALPTPTPKPAN
jgi:protein involved in polysaccharide export with SLBB domain